MWIDSNAYIGHWPFRQVKNSSCRDLIERMDANDISASVLTNINGIFYKDTQAANKETYEEIRFNRK
ncbi:MAG: amidohydrolase, partial [Cytophagales bacterium]|nr:amidohydrolase [Cytophagales bacterium]